MHSFRRHRYFVGFAEYHRHPPDSSGDVCPNGATADYTTTMGGALQRGPGGPWPTQNFGWVGHNALGPTNIGMYVP